MKYDFSLSKTVVINQVLIASLITLLKLVAYVTMFYMAGVLQAHPFIAVSFLIIVIVYRIAVIRDFYQHDKYVSFEIDSETSICTYRNTSINKTVVFELTDIRHIIETTDWIMNYFTIELENSYETMVFTEFINDGLIDVLRGLPRKDNTKCKLYSKGVVLWLFLPE